MRCTHCGAIIPDDQMICPECGAEVQIVPDYNPLDDVLAREVKGSVEGATRQLHTEDIRRQRRPQQPRNINSTRVMSQGEMDRLRDARRAAARKSSAQSGNSYGSRTSGRRNTGSVRSGDSVKNQSVSHSTGNDRGNTASRRETGRVRQNTEVLRRSREERRRQQEMRLAAAKRKRRNLLTVIFVVLAMIAAGIYLIYQNSYTGMLQKGYKALQENNYTSAENYFNRAVVKDRSRPDAYTGLSEVYMAQNDQDGAEAVFLSAIETQPSNAQLYQAAIDFYMDTEQYSSISVLLADCNDNSVLSAVSDYVSDAPEFSMDPGTYDEVIQVALTSDTGGTIYYTTDGSDPTTSSTEYTEPILLNTEAETEIRAIAVNENEIPSVVSSAKYTISFPIADAPVVNPATGQYTEPTQITITVPDGYTAYYTTDGSTPSADSSSAQKYTGPIDMPQNDQIIFSAVLVNDDNGKETAVTTRNYITTND